VLWVPSSGDRKLGGIPATYSAGATCPDACALKDQGCYAEFGKLQFHWRRVPERGLPWAAFLQEVAALPAGSLWRHNVAGDLPGVGDKLDVDALVDLVLANAGRRGFTFTHKPLTSNQQRAAVAVANRRGFTINLSADSLEHADARADLGIGPVVVTLPSDAPAGLRTPAGRHVVLCVAETRGLSCADCQLCPSQGMAARRARVPLCRPHAPPRVATGSQPMAWSSSIRTAMARPSRSRSIALG
jgi:hypothetical protein